MLSRKLIAAGEARSSGAASTIRRLSSEGAGGVAPVNMAISASVRPRPCRWNTGSLMMCRLARPRSELRAAAEAEELRTVVACFGQGIGQVDAQRPER